MNKMPLYQNEIQEYLRKGLIRKGLSHLIFDSLEEIKRLHKDIAHLREQLESAREAERQQQRAYYTFESIVGISPAIGDVIKMAKRAAGINQDVFITGESGTGKELIAQAIHTGMSP